MQSETEPRLVLVSNEFPTDPSSRGLSRPNELRSATVHDSLFNLVISNAALSIFGLEPCVASSGRIPSHLPPGVKVTPYCNCRHGQRGMEGVATCGYRVERAGKIEYISSLYQLVPTIIRMATTPAKGPLEKNLDKSDIDVKTLKELTRADAEDSLPFEPWVRPRARL